MTEAVPRVDERPWWAMDVDAVLVELHTSRDGLASHAAAKRRADAGPNELAAEPRRPRWRVFAAQFANTMIVVLLIAAAVTAVIGETTDAVVIAAIVALNAAIGFAQEHRADQAMAALRSMATPMARVIRAGRETTVPSADLVPGDLIVLETGDLVPADARLVECPNLRIDEAPLTGESVPVDKGAEPIDHRDAVLVSDRRNLVFRGTAVVQGRARAVVVATGMHTALGQIAGMLKAHRAPPTPLQRRLAVLGRRLATAAVVVCIVVFTVGVLRGEDVTLMFLTAVSLAVAAIPEALPAVVTISLALGAQRMVRRHALVRKLPAVETLGSVTVICTDKTGTLTQSRMVVERVWTLDGEVIVTGAGYAPVGALVIDGIPVRVPADSACGRLVTAAALCNDSALIAPTVPDGDWSIAGDPTEGALLTLAAKAGFDTAELRDRHPRLDEIPFDSERKRMTTRHRHDDDTAETVATKGALEVVMDAVSDVAGSHGDQPVTDGIRDAFAEQASRYAAEGFRVLAVAGRTGTNGRRADVDGDLVLYGLVAMADPPRTGSRAAVDACVAAGISPVMITGDHPATAQAIATRLGVLGDRRVMTGVELAAEEASRLSARVDRIGVYARTSPRQKLDIVQAWKARGDLVAMTGDGVNDAPALRAADIGVAMGVSGTDVAKEAADMVLTDDNFATIVAAVREGRQIYDNIRRFVRYTLTSNSGEIWVMLLGPFVGLPLPLLPVHILWINLVTDGLPGLALGVEQAERDVMRRPPRPPSESVFARGLWQHVAVVGLLMGAIPLALGVWAQATGRPWQTMVFTTLALLQLGHALAVRSEIDALRTLGLGSNRSLLLTVIGTVALQLLVIYWRPLQTLLRVDPLSAFDLLTVLVASTGVLVAVEAEKLIRRRGSGTGSTTAAGRP